MSHTLKEYMKAKRKSKPREPRVLSKEERRSLVKLRREAFAAGAKLQSGGLGGISPSLVLYVFRRDGYKCKIHGDRGEGDNGGLSLHHKGGIVESQWLSNKGHEYIANNLVVLCNRAHDSLHNKAREAGLDSSQVTPEADYDSGRDKGDRKAEDAPWNDVP